MRKPTGNPPRPYKFSMQLSDLTDGTAYLSLAELGGYARLLFAYWRNGPPRDDDRLLARVVGATPDEWRKVRPAIEPLFDVRDGQWIHWRLDEELEAASEAIKKASRAGKANARARWDKAREKDRNASRDAIEPKSVDDATAVRSQCESQFQEEDNTTAKSCPLEHRPPTTRAKERLDFGADIRIAEQDLGIGGGRGI